VRGIGLILPVLVLTLLGGDLLVLEHAGECEHHSPDCVLCPAGRPQADEPDDPVALEGPGPIAARRLLPALPAPRAAAAAPYSSRAPPAGDLHRH